MRQRGLTLSPHAWENSVPLSQPFYQCDRLKIVLRSHVTAQTFLCPILLPSFLLQVDCSRERFLGNSPCKPPPHRTPPGAADLGLEQLSFEDNGCVLQILHWLRCSSGVGIKLVVTPLPLQLLPMRELCTQEPSDQCGLKNMS